MRHVLTLLVTLSPAACGMVPEPEVTFVFHGPEARVERGEYTTTVYYHGTITAQGDSAAAHAPHLVYYRIHWEGGDPEYVDRLPTWIATPVMDGYGTVRVYGGVRSAGERGPERVRFEPMGVTRLDPYRGKVSP